MTTARRPRGRTHRAAALVAVLTCAAAALRCVSGSGNPGQDAEALAPGEGGPGSAPAGQDDNAVVPSPNDGAGGMDANQVSEPNQPAMPGADGNAVTGPAVVSSEGDGNFTVGPSFATDANLAALRDGVPAGSWQTFYVPGADSNYYTGKAAGVSPSVTINRQVQVFVPAQYVPGTEAPLLVLMDGSDFQYLLKFTLPNLIASGALPPLVAVTVSAGSAAGTGNQRSYELDAVTTRWGDYLEAEIFPLVAQKANVKLTRNPALRGTLGGSSGGAAALTLGWLRPDRYGRLVTFSGSFVNLWPTSDYPKGAWAYANGELADVARKNLRIVLQASDGDIGAGSNTERDWLYANRRVADALAAAGYPYRYTFVQGGGHEEPGALKQTIPAHLAWAWRGWQTAYAQSTASAGSGG